MSEEDHRGLTMTKMREFTDARAWDIESRWKIRGRWQSEALERDAMISMRNLIDRCVADPVIMQRLKAVR